MTVLWVLLTALFEPTWYIFSLENHAVHVSVYMPTLCTVTENNTFLFFFLSFQ
jgi:hypothetical protein